MWDRPRRMPLLLLLRRARGLQEIVDEDPPACEIRRRRWLDRVGYCYNGLGLWARLGCRRRCVVWT